jgi:hypothetical protein
LTGTEAIGLVVILLILGVFGLFLWKGKDLLKVRTLQGGFFKQLAFWSSSPVNAQKVLFFSESGHISAELLPIFTGYMVDSKSKRAWLSMNPLKYEVFFTGNPTG